MGTTVITPERSREQRMSALGKANDTRIRRAALKRDLKHGRCRVADVLADPPGCAATMKVLDLLLATPRIGRVKANRMLKVLDVSSGKRVGGLSARQREGLLSRLGCGR